MIVKTYWACCTLETPCGNSDCAEANARREEDYEEKCEHGYWYYITIGESMPCGCEPK